MPTLARLRVTCLIALLALTACDSNEAERQLLLSELSDAEITREELHGDVRRLKDEVSGLQRRYDGHLDDMESLGLDIAAYQGSNFMKSGAFSFASSAADTLGDSRASEGEKQAAAIGGLISAWVLFNDPMGSMQYKSEMDAANKRKGEFEAKLAELVKQMAAKQTALDPKQVELDAVAAKIKELREQIRALQ